MADGVCRTDFDTFPTVNAQLLIDHSQVVFDLNGVHRADAYTAPTGDTADFAGLSDDFGRPVVGTGDIGRKLVFGDHVDEKLRTGVHAFPAGCAVIVIDMRDTIFQVQRVEFTDGHTVTETEAAEGARIRTREKAGG